MAHENTWSSLEDGQPTGANLLGQVDDFIRQTRQMVRERIALEHDFNFLINDQQGFHRQGSARVWVSETQPASPIPDPTGTETMGSETIGRCWFKPSTGEYFVYDKASASWIPVNLTTSQMAALLHAMTAKTSLADNDEFALADSAAAYGPKKTLWSTIKSVIKTALSIGGSNALSQDDIGDGTSYKRIGAAKADKINNDTYSQDDIADGTSYKRIQAAKVDAINNETRLPTVAGTADANLIGALSKIANAKLFVNAAGNGFEYAKGIKVIFTTRDISITGTQSITGAGFKPSWAIALSTVTNTAMLSIGLCDGTNSAIILQNGAGICDGGGGLFIDIVVNESNYAYANLTSFDSDGATLTWGKTGSPTGIVRMYLLWGR